MRSILFSCLLLIGISVQAQTYPTAVSYNDAIVNIQNTIANSIIRFNEALSVESATMEQTLPYYSDLITTTEAAIVNVRNLPAFEGDTLLRESAEDLFEFYASCFKNEYQTILTLFFKPDMTAEEYDQMTALLNDISTREAVYDLSFQNAQYLFALKNGFTLEENTLQDDLNGD